MEVLGLIGARAGSKGVPDKNVRPLLGRPLLSYPIAMARRCRHINRVILSTDSEEYAETGRHYGAETPFLRPAELASDSAIDLGFIRHAIEWLELNAGYRPDLVVRLYPTTPLVHHEDVDRCIELLMGDDNADSAIMMTPAREHPRKAAMITADGAHVVAYMTERASDLAPSLRQGHTEAYNRQGLPVVSRRDTILKLGSQTGEIVRFHLVPEGTAIDIDTELDFTIVEALLAQRGSS